MGYYAQDPAEAENKEREQLLDNIDKLKAELKEARGLLQEWTIASKIRHEDIAGNIVPQSIYYKTCDLLDIEYESSGYVD